MLKITHCLTLTFMPKGPKQRREIMSEELANENITLRHIHKGNKTRKAISFTTRSKK